MKTRLFILSMILVLTGITANAQLHTLGLDRSIGGPGHFKDTRKKEPVKESDMVEAAVNQMEMNLTLDAFQKAAVKTFIIDYKDAIIAIDQLQIPDEGKKEKMEVEKDKMEARVLSLLNEEQAAKFAELKNKKGKKGKKK